MHIAQPFGRRGFVVYGGFLSWLIIFAMLPFWLIWFTFWAYYWMAIGLYLAGKWTIVLPIYWLCKYGWKGTAAMFRKAWQLYQEDRASGLPPTPSAPPPPPENPARYSNRR
jgi:hypothetical protein